MGKVSRESVNVITAKTRLRISRRHPGGTPTAVARHAQQTGEVIHAWNLAHGSLFRLFMRIAADDDYILALSLWHTVQSDTTQRQMVAGAVDARLAKYRKNRTFVGGLNWAIGALNELCAYRNDAAHTEMLIYYDQMVPGLSNKPSMFGRLSKSPLAKHCRALCGDLYAVANYLEIIDFSLRNEMPRPLSRRPRLLLLRSRTALSQERRRRAKKASRERQRQSSRA
jgi:hypothetical protein